MSTTAELGDFLRTRRSQLRPEVIGVPTYGERRRVPGLRRDELARLAGVSTSYFLDPHTRELYADWPSKAKAVVGNLRLMAGQHPTMPRCTNWWDG